MNLEITIDRVFSYLRDLCRPIGRKRRPGVDVEAIIARLHVLGLQGPPDLVQLYSLCDGTETVVGDLLDEIQFFPGFYWMNLDKAITTYKSLVKDGRWSAAWLPIFANGGGDFYAVICDEKSHDFGGLVGFILGESDQIIEFENVSSMFRTIERSFAEKAFFVSNGRLQADYPKMRAIARSVQPAFTEHDA